MSDTVSKYWEDNDTFPKETKKEWQKNIQKLIDSDPNYNGELDELVERPKLNKTVYRILAEYDEDDILAAADLLMSQRRRKNNEFKWK
jgi:replicative superfamily II helicase